MSALASAVLPSRVTHARKKPVGNAFTYNVDYLLLHEDDLAGGGPRLFSHGRTNLVCLHDKDHGLTPDADLTGPDWIRQIARDNGLGEIAEIALLTHPRYWGYVFNPVSFWLMSNDDGELVGVLAEVHNTFGDRHAYLCRSPNGGPITPDMWMESDKVFHVSPFFEIKGNYRFRFVLDGEKVAVWIIYEDGEGGGLHTSLVAHRRPFSDVQLVRALVRRPLGAIKMMALIHWQALKLFAKGVRYNDRPEPGKEQLT